MVTIESQTSITCAPLLPPSESFLIGPKRFQQKHIQISAATFFVIYVLSTLPTKQFCLPQCILLFYGVGKLQGPSIFVGKLLVVGFVGSLTGCRFSVGNLTFSQN